jgi:RimJ/RimL family protein N-acetyltransferase
MLRADEFVRPGLKQPPGGVDDPEVLSHVRHLATKLRHDGYSGGHWMMIAGDEVVGLCGFKALPTRDGEIELGYGVSKSRQRLGHATAAVAAVVEATRGNPAVRTIIALTATANLASQKVLDRNGFQHIGMRIDPEDGEVLLWRMQL